MNVRKRAVGSAVLGVALATMATPAFAEGGFTSSISGWLTGLETRDWNDNNTDDVSTRFGARGCSYDTGRDVDSIAMELNRNDTYTPDEHYGNRTVACNNSTVTTVGWGDKGKGNFDMTLKLIDGQVRSTQGKLNVSYVRVSY